MSILVYTESEEGKFKKTAYEVASYARALANTMNTTTIAVSINAEETESLGNYGVNKVLKVKDEEYAKFNAASYAQIIAQAAKQEEANIIILSSSANARYLAPLLAVKLDAGYASNVVALPDSTAPFTVKRTAFTNKAFSFTELTAATKILSIGKNTFGVKEEKADCTQEDFNPTIAESETKVEVQSVDKAKDKVSIADAEIVVSGGRGLKGPENWGMLEELADTLGAATACSKPVSDMGWRPHSEHVGQTGKPVAANLYVAVGISGAIQHLAGINASKTKLVINNDPEAPFFKTADYGVVGDAFEIVPKLNEKLKAFKANN